MRVMFVCGTLPPAKPICGVSDLLVKLAEALLSKGVHIAVITNQQDKVPVIADSANAAEIFSVIENWGFREIPKVLAHVRKWHPDVVHIQYPTQGYGRSWMPYFLPIILRLLGKPVVQTWHEHTRYRFFPNALTTDTLVVVDPDFMDRVKKRYKWLVRRKSIHFIQNASNIPTTSLSEIERKEIRSRWLINGSNIVVFFGFVYPGKGLETVFEIADPVEDTIVIIGDMDFENNAYHRSFLPIMNSRRWKSKVTVTGYMDAMDVARLLAAADAVLCPFENGVRHCNSTFLAALAQGTFIVTTAKSGTGYDAKDNVFYSNLGDIDGLRIALKQYKGSRLSKGKPEIADWARYADDHISVYQAVISNHVEPFRNHV